MKRITLFAWCLLALALLAPRAGAQHSIGITASWSQVQDELNNGMVFSGPAATLHYGYMKNDGQTVFRYQFSIGGVLLDNRGIMGVALHAVPVDLFYGYQVGSPGGTELYIGPRLQTNYNVQLYPDLQSGLDFWATSIHLAPSLMLDIPSKDHLIRLEASVAVLGLLSRTPGERDPYYFSLNAWDIIADMHSDMSLASFETFFQTEFRADYAFGTSRTWTLGYGIEYLEYFDTPGFTKLNHNLNVQYRIGE